MRTRGQEESHHHHTKLMECGMTDPRQVLIKETSPARGWCYQSLKVAGAGVIKAYSSEVGIVYSLAS